MLGELLTSLGDAGGLLIRVQGNWLVLERWMNEDWFIENAGDALDQWTFTQVLGPERATAALRQHYDTWVTEADMCVGKGTG